MERPYYPPPDHPPPHYLRDIVGDPIDIPIPQTHRSHCEVPLFILTPCKAVTGDARATFVLSRPKWRETLAELEGTMMRSSPAHSGCEGNALNHSTKHQKRTFAETLLRTASSQRL